MIFYKLFFFGLLFTLIHSSEVEQKSDSEFAKSYPEFHVLGSYNPENFVGDDNTRQVYGKL